MEDVLQRLSEDHQHISRVMEIFDQQVALFDTDDDVNWSLLADVVAYLQEYPDAVHHPLEDELFDRVLDKGLTPAERELVHLNLSQHSQIIDATNKLARDIADILRDMVVPLDRLQDHCRDYMELQRVHMRNEYVHLFPLAERLLDEQDWREIGESLEQRPDPMFERQLGRYESLYRHVQS